jgi:hypothetical protein
LAKTNALEDGLNPGLTDAKHPRRELQVFDRRQVVVKARSMRQKSDVAANLDGGAHEMMTANPSFAGRRAQCGGHDSEQRTLAAPVMSNNPNDFTRLNLESDATESPPGSEATGQTLELER